jgi:hypothetical protein
MPEDTPTTNEVLAPPRLKAICVCRWESGFTAIATFHDEWHGAVNSYGNKIMVSVDSKTWAVSDFAALTACVQEIFDRYPAVTP